MGWAFSDAVATFRQHARLWDELNVLTGNHILLDAVSVQAQLDHLAQRPVLLARWTDSNAPAMLLLESAGPGRWMSFQPAQQPIGNALFLRSGAVEEQLSELMRKLPGCAMLVGITGQDPAFSRIPQLTGSSLPVEWVAYQQTGRVELRPDFATYWRERPPDLRDGMARRQRRLDRDGQQVTLTALDDPALVEQAIHHYSLLEGGGWKGQAGTAVGTADRQGRFYNALLKDRCQQGEGMIFQLRIGERLAASQLCVHRDGMLVSLKIAYDEGLRRDAPGYLLQAKIIELLHSRPPIRSIEFYGRATDGWTLKWTGDLRTIFHVNVYRSEFVQTSIRLARSLLSHGASNQLPTNGSP